MSSPPIEPTTTSSEVDAVRAVALDYIEGWYAGDAERMDRSLHDDLVKRTPLRADGSSSALRSVSKERMVELTSSGGGSDVTAPGIEVYVEGPIGDTPTSPVPDQPIAVMMPRWRSTSMIWSAAASGLVVVVSMCTSGASGGS